MTPLSNPFIQLGWLLLTAIPVACISWTITHEELFNEAKRYCRQKCESAKSIITRKFFYLFTCEYCFSHYITILVLCISHFKLLFDDWRGYFFSGFSIVWVANVYMSLYQMMRVNTKKSNRIAQTIEKSVLEAEES
jgi:hypothetical protein